MRNVKQENRSCKECKITVFEYVNLGLSCRRRHLVCLSTLCSQISRLQSFFPFGGCGIRLKIEAGCGIMKIFVTGCRMKLQRLDWDKLIRDKMATCE